MILALNKVLTWANGDILAFAGLAIFLAAPEYYSVMYSVFCFALVRPYTDESEEVRLYK